MGAKISFLDNDQLARQFMPMRKLEAFPRCRFSAPGSLLTFFKVMPPGHKLPQPLPDDLFWWLDCRFLPYKDNEMAVTFGAYRERMGMTPVVYNRSYNGVIYTMEFSKTTRCNLIKGMKTSVMPHIVPHPNAVQVGFLGVGNFTLMDLKTLDMQTKDKMIGENKYVYLDISPNGLFHGIISRSSRKFCISIWKKDILYFTSIAENQCHHICKGFYGSTRFTDHVECKFSPDSKHVAVGASFGMLFIAKLPELASHCCVIPGMFDVSEVALANARSFDFDPRFKHRILAFGSSTGDVYTCDINDKSVHQMAHVEGDESIQCVKYGVRGEVLAVATSEAIIYMYCPDNMELLFKLDHTLDTLPAEPAMEEINNRYPTFLRMSFSWSGDIMSVASTDGMVRLWQLQPNLSLQHLCKLAVLQNVQISQLKHLPLPPRIIFDLLEWPTD